MRKIYAEIMKQGTYICVTSPRIYTDYYYHKKTYRNHANTNFYSTTRNATHFLKEDMDDGRIIRSFSIFYTTC